LAVVLNAERSGRRVEFDAAPDTTGLVGGDERRAGAEERVDDDVAQGLGILGRLNDVLARHAVNIAAQYYDARGDIGCVVLDADVSAADSQRVLSETRSLEGTIRARLLYEHRL
jgi:hypothetical protein